MTSSVIPYAGDGSESINLYCSGNKETINQFLPTSEEILEEILREYGYEPVPDEKRSSYLPVIKRFRGLYLAGKAFTGQSATILEYLEKQPKTIKEIQGACRLGDGILAGPSYLQQVEWMFTGQSKRIKRIGHKRFENHSREGLPESLRLSSLLEYWADRSILTRHWETGPCRRCRTTAA